jgi:hypothetical protein
MSGFPTTTFRFDAQKSGSFGNQFDAKRNCAAFPRPWQGWRHVSMAM